MVSLGLLLDHIQDAVLERLFVFAESVLLPGVVRALQIISMPHHAFFEQSNYVLEIGVLLKL